jgi:hypothetical protein
MNRHYLLFFAGIAIMTMAVMVGTAGFSYEFTLKSTADTAPTQSSFASYSDFSSEERRMIRRSIDGETFVFEDRRDLPAASGEGWSGQLTVEYEDTFYTFKRGAFFDVSTLGGSSATTLGIIGLVATTVAVRGDMRARETR